jgi:ribose-phosphate pyrophosphokinase
VELIREAGVGEIWSTDCIAHPTNAVSVVPAVAAVLRELVGSGTGAARLR